MITIPAAPPAIRPESGADKLDPHEKMRIRAAAFRATKLYPGPVGELLAKELLDWEGFGYRFGGHTLTARLVDHVLGAALPTGGTA
ncbi:hypothetical protein [Pseudonocardia sp. NPDC049154]|uniref:hypothetical protein n=1 Tax=Pseudonocardia sp. NPDC049154 TaxID=3155501 RepID=UPI0033D8FA15